MRADCYFALLGPVRARRSGRELDLGSPQQRLTLALLLLHEGRPVRTESIVDALWGDEPPAVARGAVRTYVYRLRKLLNPDGAEPLLVSAEGGYQLLVEPDQVDLTRFRLAVRAAESARAVGDLPAVAVQLRAALELWRDTPLTGLRGPYAEGQRTRLEQQRMDALEELFTVQLELGRYREVIGEAMAATAKQPLRERLRELQMLALYRSGRSAEALMVFEETRRLLNRELGAEPGPALRALHERILRADPALLPGESPAQRAGPVTPSQLPAALPVFVGRREPLAELMRLPAPVVAIRGMPGVGKTTLALHWAHRIAGQFPDGQLYVDLRGFDSGGVVEPGEALRGFLDALGAPSERIPHGVPAQAALFRSLVARRRILLVLDNARDTAHVLPLLPGTSHCQVLVTSRDHLGGLVAAVGAHPVDVGTMSPAEAQDLLSRRLGEQRVAAEPEAAAEIAALCHRLPLALAVVAARAVARPRFRLAALAAELREAKGSLDAFSAADRAADLGAVFSWSLHALSPAAARVFRLLAVHPGNDAGLAAVSVLAGLPQPETALLLAELVAAHLVIEHAPGRFRQHDLLRAYAGDTQGEPDPAPLRRLLDHYLHTARAAAALATRHPDWPQAAPPEPGAHPVPLRDHAQGTEWISAEYPALLAAIEFSLCGGFPEHAWKLAWAIRHFQDRQGHWRDLAAMQRLALTAAARLGDPIALAYAHRGVARAATRAGNLAEARGLLEEAARLFGGAGEDRARAYTLRQLTHVCELAGHPRQALDHAEQALKLFRANGCQVGVAAALDDIRHNHARLGNDLSASGCPVATLELLRELNDRRGQIDALVELARRQAADGATEAARAALLEAEAILTDLDIPDTLQIRATLATLD